MAGRLFQRIEDLQKVLQGFKRPPTRTGDERVVHDAWTAALKPRAPRLERRAGRLADLKLWEFDEDRRPDHLRPGAWPEVVREAASLVAELAGALAQHERVRIVWRPKLRFGIQRGSNAPVATTKEKAKARSAAGKAREQAREAQQKAAQKILAASTKRLEEARTAIRAALAETRHLVAALQEAEEARLAKRAARLKEGTPAREEAEDLLVQLHQARLEGERHEGGAAYGSILRRRWLQPRAKLIHRLEGP